jgi:hypothetical protein
MKIIRTPGQGLGQRLIFDEHEFDLIGLQALRDAGCIPSIPGPVRIDRFVEKYFKLTLDYQDLGSGVLGATAFAKTGRVCGMAVAKALATEESQNLFRSTVAHEAGHGLLHPILFMEDSSQGGFRIDNADTKSRRILCRANDIKPGQGRGYDGRWWEYQANRMIGSLLLPRPLVQQAVEPYLTRAAVTGTPSLLSANREVAVAYVANIFQVSPIVAMIRLGEVYPQNDSQMEF